MATQNIILALGAALLLATLLTSFMNPFFRLKRKDAEADVTDDDDHGKSWPCVSIVITASNNLDDLRSTLPHLLHQDYPAPYEVIVVLDELDKELDDYLTQLDHQERLYRTFIPPSSRYLSRKKLSVTVGVKAAKHDWILLTESTCRPNSDQWLRSMARNCQPSCQLVMGYGHYEEDANPFYRFEQLQDTCYLLHEIRLGNPYYTRIPNLMFRKKQFIEGDGYKGSLEFTSGIYEFIVNKYGQGGNVATALSPASVLTIHTPTEKEWRAQQLLYHHARRHLARGWHHRMLLYMDHLLLHTYLLLLTGSLACAVITLSQPGLRVHAIALLALAILTLVLTLALRCHAARQAILYFNESIELWRIPLYDLRLFWHKLLTAIRYALKDKTYFTTHKL